MRVANRVVTAICLFVAFGFVMDRSHGTTITFNPTTANQFVDQEGFTGIFNPDDPYTRARIRVSVLNLTSANFDITNVLLKGPGISGSLNFGTIQTTGTSNVFTNFLDLNSSVDPLNFAASSLSFDLPAGINVGAIVRFAIQYQDTGENQTNTSNTLFVEAVPEPSTFVLASMALGLCGIAAARRWRVSRQVSLSVWQGRRDCEGNES
jgi:hypothetical protein